MALWTPTVRAGTQSLRARWDRGGDREGAGRDGETAEMHVRDAGGAWEQGPERRSHGSSL